MSNTGKSKNGNGGDNGSSLDDDDVTPTVTTPLPPPENRRMLSILADYVTEAKVHSSRLDNIYVTLREMTVAPSPVWAGTLLTELERHHSAEGENLGTLREYLMDPKNAGSIVVDGDEPDDED